MGIRSYLSELVKDELSAVYQVLFGSKPLLIAFFLCLAGIIAYLEPFPDRRITIGSGYEGGDWYQVSQYAAEQLNKNGLNASTVVTDGAQENVRRLIDPKDSVNAAFTYGLAVSPDQAQQIVSLGSVSYDPIWIFYRKEKIRHLDNLHELTKYRVGLGPAGSGSFAVSKKLFSFYGIDIAAEKNFISESFQDIEAALLAGKVDVLVMVLTERDPIVQKLMRTPGIALYGFADAEAFEKKYNSLRKVVLPAGSISLYPKIPTTDIPLVATTSSLVVKKDLHPDLQMALLMMTKQIVRDSTHLFFSERNEFPAYVDPLIPISPVAARFYDYGPPQAMRYLPLWLGGFVDRAWVFMLALVAIFYPLSKLNLHVRKLRFVAEERPHYSELLAIDRMLMQEHLSEETRVQILKRLRHIHESAQTGEVPVGEESHYFALLQTVKLLEDKANARWTS